MNKFPKVLKEILTCGKFDMNHWAEYLFITKRKLTDWTMERSIPQPDHILKILALLEGFKDKKVVEAIEHFHAIADLPLKEVASEDTAKKFKTSTLADYVMEATFPRLLSYEFSQVPSKYRGPMLSLCRKIVKEATVLLKEPDNEHVKALVLDKTKKSVIAMLNK